MTTPGAYAYEPRFSQLLIRPLHNPTMHITFCGSKRGSGSGSGRVEGVQ